ncbi:MAG: hypothetical protein B5M56_06555 [Desulfococcus sp. 4484_241]|nr:MAG: hypothetical protein B5M56_06555 [Desulfococcus sp. 4484_241]
MALPAAGIVFNVIQKGVKMKTVITVFAAMILAAAFTTVPVSARTIVTSEWVNGKGYLSSDLSPSELEQIVGRGIISQMSPDDIGRIDACGLLPTPEDIHKMARDLLDTTIKGVRIVIDRSKYTNRELAEVLAGWEKFLANL